MIRLWRLTRLPFLALDGAGTERHGSRWISPGLPVVNFASEASLAVLIALRYLPPDLRGIADYYVLGWIESAETPERLSFTVDPDEKRRRGDDWFHSGRSVFAAVPSAVMPEGDVIMMNTRHPLAASIAPLVTRPFSFHDCLKLLPLPEVP